MKVAIYSRVMDWDHRMEVQQLFDALVKQKLELLIYRPYYEQIVSGIPIPPGISTFGSAADLDSSIEFLISLGGDGTILDAVTLVRDKNIPILGINFGRLGFLAGIGKEEVTMAVEALVAGTYVTDKRTLIHLDASTPLFGDTPFALNEFAIHKRDTSPMIKVHTYLNGEFLNTYWSD